MKKRKKKKKYRVCKRDPKNRGLPGGWKKRCHLLCGGEKIARERNEGRTSSPGHNMVAVAKHFEDRSPQR
jgi:hypothetical protein